MWRCGADWGGILKGSEVTLKQILGLIVMGPVGPPPPQPTAAMSDAASTLGKWTVLDDADSLKEAKTSAKRMDLGTAGKWRVDRSAPGDGVTRAALLCNAHEACMFRMSIKRVAGNWCIMTTGVHSDEVKATRLKDSKLTFDQEAYVRTQLKVGAAPAEVLAAMTDDKLEECKMQGEQAVKRKEGGLEGVQCSEYAPVMHFRTVFCAYSMTCVESNPYSDTYSMHIPTHIPCP